MKVIKIILLLVVLSIIGSILYTGYLGFIPFLSSMMGTDKPKDLGVRYTKADYESFASKTNGDIIPITEPADPARSISYSGRLDINNNFSQQEISGRLNYARWKYMPITNTQVRINQDGSVEVSGSMILDRLPGFIAREGMGKWTMADVSKGLEFIKWLKINPPVYMKFNASITDNNPQGNINTIMIGKFNVPIATVKADETARSLFQTITSKAEGFYAKSVTFTNGNMHYEGTIPAKMMVETK